MIDESKERFQEVFGRQSTVIASAPGRLEILGNHLDYNGGRVVGVAIDRRITVAVSARTDDLLRLATDRESGVTEHRLGKPFDQFSGPAWAAFPLGVVASFRTCLTGFDLSVTSNLPVGAGLSSSAAIELAVAVALNELFSLELGREELITVSHRAETEFVGVPCGTLDQNVVGLGKKGSLIVLDHATDSHTMIPIPETVSFVVFPTHVAHWLRESPYAERKRQCSEAIRTLSRFVPGSTHLAHFHPSDLDAYGSQLGRDAFKRSLHVIEEQRRVDSFISLMRENDQESAGSCLFASHKSSRELFENSITELDFLVEVLHEQPGVLGARLTGAGFGGAVLAMVTDTFDLDSLLAVENAYKAQFGVEILPWHAGTDDGARIELAANRRSFSPLDV